MDRQAKATIYLEGPPRQFEGIPQRSFVCAGSYIIREWFVLAGFRPHSLAHRWLTSACAERFCPATVGSRSPGPTLTLKLENWL